MAWRDRFSRICGFEKLASEIFVPWGVYLGENFLREKLPSGEIALGEIIPPLLIGIDLHNGSGEALGFQPTHFSSNSDSDLAWREKDSIDWASIRKLAIAT